MEAVPSPAADVLSRALERRGPTRFPRPLGQGRGPGTVLDPVLIALVALVVYALHGYDGALSRDYGLFVYGGEQVAQGVPPYVEVFNSVGPLADALPGLAIWIGHGLGADPVLAARVAYTVISASCCALVAVLARDVLRSRAAGFVASAVFLTFGSFLRLASAGPRDKSAMVLFLLVALLLLGRRRWAAAGVVTALATLTWQPAFLLAAAVAAVALLGAPSRRLRGAAAYLAGGTATAAAAVAFYWFRGDLGTAIGGFLTVNLRYTRQPSLLGRPGYVWPVLWEGYRAGLVVLAAGLLALVALAVRTLPWARVRDRDAVTLASLAAGGLAGTTWTVLVVNGAPDLFELLPLGALGIAAVVVAASRRLRPRTSARLVALVAAAGVVLALVESVTTRDHSLVTERADVRAVMAAAPPGADVASINAPQVPALAQVRDPLRYQLFDRRMRAYLGHTTPGGVGTYAELIAETDPTFVVTARHGRRAWISPVLTADYRRIGRGPSWTWYLTRTAGPGVARAVRAANASVMSAGYST